MNGMKNIFLFIILICSHVTWAKAFNHDFPAVEALVKRRMPQLSGKLVLQKMPASISRDTAVYYTKSGKLYIKSSTSNAAAYALNQYLQNRCHSSFSHTGSQMQIPAKLPEVILPEGVSARFPLRYALNYCTYNYTMSFWQWEDWEKELDWMALNGVNLMLAPGGTEAVWQKTLQDLSYSDMEIRAFLPGPAFNAWWLMGNLEGWGGPVSDQLIQHAATLQQKVLKRMKELSIQPVIQGFYGMVPSTLKKHFPKAKILDQGTWCGFQRPSVLAPQDPLFEKISAIYYKYLKQLYGGDIQYLAGDLFHEGGNTSGIDIKETGRLVQANMQQHLPCAVWVLQGWQGNPKPQMMEGLNPAQTLVLDLMGDNSENWARTNGYQQFPWIWCTITNFGGRQGMEGKLERVIAEPNCAVQTKEGQSMVGVGIIPEGIENNAIVYQWLLDGAWNTSLANEHERLPSFIISRYGEKDENLLNAWRLLLQSVYASHGANQQGAFESIFCARPTINLINNVSSWGPEKPMYDSEMLLKAAMHFSKSADRFMNIATYRYDLVDMWRQLLNLKARTIYEALMRNFHQRDKSAFAKNKSRFITLLQLQNEWTGTHQHFRVGTWINKAKKMLPSVADKKLLEWNARTQITYWGGDDPATPLHEYAHKEWNGLLEDLYLQRWLAFFRYAEAEMDGKEAVYPDFFGMEKNGPKPIRFIHLYRKSTPPIC
jgi:alpha-N-acetylglucosaminidase